MQLISCQKSATRVNHSLYFKASRDMDGGMVLKILPEILRQPFNVIKFLNLWIISDRVDKDQGYQGTLETKRCVNDANR